MRLETNAEFSVFATDPISIAHAFKSVRSIAPHFTLGDFKQCVIGRARLFRVNTYRNEISEYLGNLRLILNALKELREYVSGLVLTDVSSNEFSIEDLEETLAFHESYQPNNLEAQFRAYLKALEDADWIAHGGELVADEATTSVGRPPQSDSTWSYLQVALQNRITNLLVEQFGYHHGCLQVHYDQLMPNITHLTRSKLQSAPTGFFNNRNEPSGLIMLSCIEQYFSEVLPTVVVFEWVQWLNRGHVPCGWVGDFPNGKLLVW